MSHPAVKRFANLQQAVVTKKTRGPEGPQRRSPDLLNNVKIGQGQLQLLMEQILFLPYTFWSSDLNNLMNNPSNSPVISEKKMLR